MKPQTETTQPVVLQQRNKSLDALRGIFAIMVVYSHIELIRSYFGLSEVFFIPIVSQLGRIGVTGFFVLSGFLITINLLKAREKEGSAGGKLRSFYLKRILRIWPLYYAVVLLAIFVFPHVPALHFTIPAALQDARTMPGTRIYYYILLPQVPLAKNIVLPFAEPTWSIGVEEIFYLIIPFFPLFVNVKKNAYLYVAALFVIAKYYLYYMTVDNPAAYPVASFLLNFLNLCRFECILMGCFIGYLYYTQHKYVEKLGIGHFIAAFVLLFVFSAMVEYRSYQYYHFAAMFAIIILYAAKNANTFLNNRVLAFVGKISFSLYMTHELAVVFLHNNPFFREQIDTTPFLALYIIIPLAAILLAFVVYNILERPFLILKERLK